MRGKIFSESLSAVPPVALTASAASAQWPTGRADSRAVLANQAPSIQPC